MQFCSKSELYQSIKTCNCFSAEQAVAAADGPHHASSSSSSSNNNNNNGGLYQQGPGRHATIFSANIDPPSCASQYDFPCWSSASPDLRRALQNDLPDDWRELLKIPAFRASVAKQTFFDRPDTSKLSTLLAGIQGGGSRSKDSDGGAGGEEDSDAEPVVSFAELFKKRPVPGVDDAVGVGVNERSGEDDNGEPSGGSKKQSGGGVAERDPVAPDGRSAFELDEEEEGGGGGEASEAAASEKKKEEEEGGEGAVSTPTKTQAPAAQGDAMARADGGDGVSAAHHPYHSGLHQLLFGSAQGAKASDGNSTNAAGDTAAAGTATAAGLSAGAGGSDAAAPAQGMTTIDVYLPDASRTKIELSVAPTYSMSRTIKLLLAQAAVRAALGPLPEHQDLHPAHYELKLHDEDGIALDMAHNLGDKTVAETGEDEFVLQRKPTAPTAGTAGAAAAASSTGAATTSGAGGQGSPTSPRNSAHLSPILPQVSPGIKVLFSDLHSAEPQKFKSFASQSGLELRHWFPKLQLIGVIRVGEEYEFRLKSEDIKRLGRRSGLLKLTTPVKELAQLGVREIKLCPKTYYDYPKPGSPKVLTRTMSTRSRSLTQGGLGASPRAIPSEEGEEVADLTEFMFDEITGAAKKEWNVIKINNQKRRQERVIGVDMTRIYNSKPKDKFHFKGVTKKWRDIEDLESCPWPFDRTQPKRFRLVFRDPDEGGLVNIDYEAKTPQEAGHIVAKILYIQQNLLGH